MMTYLLLAGLSITILNLIATLPVVLAGVYDRSQKIRQLLLIWLVPIVGAALCLLVLAEIRRASRTGSRGPRAADSYVNHPNDLPD